MPRKKKISKQIEVSVQKDHLRKLSTRRPLQAIQELIWNSLDADATRVEVVLEKNLWGGIQRIAIVDNGEGILPARVFDAFERLGGSWKQESESTSAGRRLHGKEGKGRFAAFSLGSAATWTSIAEDEEGQLHALRIESTSAKIDRFNITSTPIQPTNPPQTVGTTVTIDNVPESVHGLIGEAAITTMLDKFALYLRKYPEVEIIYNDERLDPEAAIASTESRAIELEVEGELQRAEVEIVEWKRKVSRGIYLCDSGGFTALELPLGLSAIERRITAHVKSEAIETLRETGALSVGDMHPLVRALLHAARGEITDFHERTAGDANAQRIEGWQREEVFPFSGSPSSELERAQRDAFIVLASEAEERMPELRRQKARSKRLLFVLLRDAVERDDSANLHITFARTLGLNDEQDNELGARLDATGLGGLQKPARRGKRRKRA